MEELLKITLLAIIQGVTEFLPISSSGHLVLLKHLLGLETGEGATLEIVLHAGTLVSIFIFYRRRHLQIIQGVVRGESDSLRFAGLILLGALPATAVGLVAGGWLRHMFSDPHLVSIMLLVTGLFLVGSHYAVSAMRPISWSAALWIGLAQAAAMLPGISRSGSTICTARFLGINPEKAAEYSFLMSVPLLLGAVLLETAAWIQEGNGSGCSPAVLTLGFAVSAVVGVLALKWLVSLLQHGRFWRFGIYCIAFGTFALLFFTF